MVELTARVALESMMAATADDATPIIRRLARIQARTVLDQMKATPDAAASEAGEVHGFRSMDTWDSRDEPVMLLVDYRGEGDHPLEDANFAITVGHNNDHNVGEGEGTGWHFAGWCWSHDHYVEGRGKPVGWMPLPHILARAYEAFEGEHAALTTQGGAEG